MIQHDPVKYPGSPRKPNGAGDCASARVHGCNASCTEEFAPEYRRSSVFRNQTLQAATCPSMRRRRFKFDDLIRIDSDRLAVFGCAAQPQLAARASLVFLFYHTSSFTLLLLSYYISPTHVKFSTSTSAAIMARMH